MSDHELRLGDCLEGVVGLADRSVAHCISDPPYESEAHTLGRRARPAGGGEGADPRALDFAPIGEQDRSDVARHMARVAQRWILVFCQVEAAMKWRSALEAGGARYMRTMVWIKPDATPQFTGDRPGMGYESIVVAYAVSTKSRWNAGGKRGVYEFTGDPCRDHMTQKPVRLMEALIRDFTDPGELICDPFAGSGTTGVACKRLGRRFIGWERDPKFHAAAVKRLEATREQLELGGKRIKQKNGVLL